MDELMDYVPDRVYLGLTPRDCLLVSDAQIAIVSWLFSRKLKGFLKLNIHDLTAPAYQPAWENELVTNLKWLGVQLDELPVNSGELKVTRESERREIYKEYLWKLLLSQKVLFFKNKTNFKITEIIKKNGTRTAVLAFKSNAFKITENEFDPFIAKEQFDIILDPAAIKDSELSDFRGKVFTSRSDFTESIILWTKSGEPGSVLARAVDLHLFEISHFVINEKELSQLFAIREVMQALSWEMVSSIILPGVGFTHFNCIENLRRDGYLPNTIVSILGFLGKASQLIQGQNSEENVLRLFDPELLATHRQLVDDEKLNTVNSYYLNTLGLDFIVKLIIPFLLKNNISLKNKARIHQIVDFLRSYFYRLSDLAREVRIFSDDILSVSDKVARNILRKESAQKVLWSFLRNTKAVEKMSQDVFFNIMNTVQYETGILGRDLWQPVRVALTGSLNQYELARFSELLGRDLCINRISTIVGNYW